MKTKVTLPCQFGGYASSDVHISFFFMNALRDDAKSVVIFLFIKSFAPTSQTTTLPPFSRSLYLLLLSLLSIRLKSIKSSSTNTQTTDSIRFTLFYLHSHEYGPIDLCRSSSKKHFSPSSFFLVCWFFLISPTIFQNEMASTMTVAMNFFATTLNSMSISFFSHSPPVSHHHTKNFFVHVI